MLRSNNFLKNLQKLFSENYSLLYSNKRVGTVGFGSGVFSNNFKHNYGVYNKNLNISIIDYLCFLKLTLFF